MLALLTHGCVHCFSTVYLESLEPSDPSTIRIALLFCSLQPLYPMSRLRFFHRAIPCQSIDITPLKGVVGPSNAPGSHVFLVSHPNAQRCSQKDNPSYAIIQTGTCRLTVTVYLVRHEINRDAHGCLSARSDAGRKLNGKIVGSALQGLGSTW